MMGVFELIHGLGLSVQDNSSWMAMFVLGGCSLCLKHMQGRLRLGTLYSEFVHARCSSEEGSEVNSSVLL